MSLLNSLLRVVFDGLLYPFRELPPLVGLVVMSIVTAVGILLVFKKTSNQKALVAVKRRIHASFFEMRLFFDDFRAVFRAQFAVLRHNLTYLRLSFVPLLWMIVPMVLIVAQLQFHYGYRGLAPGDTALLEVELADGVDTATRPPITVQAPPGLRVKTPAVWIPSLKEMAWRVVAEMPGDYEIEVSLDGNSTTKTVTVTDAIVRLSPIRPDDGVLQQIIYPAESPVPAGGPIRSIHLTYLDRDLPLGVFGWRTHWLVIYFILSMLFAFLLRNRFGVAI